MNMSTEYWWDYIDRGDGYTVRKTGPSVAFPTTDLIFTVLGSNTGLRGVSSEDNQLRHCTAFQDGNCDELYLMMYVFRTAQ
jgi:hypothetical protein